MHDTTNVGTPPASGQGRARQSGPVYRFRRNQREEVHARILAGSGYLELRVFARGPDGARWPTRKGLVVHPNLLAELERAVAALREAITTGRCPDGAA